MKNQECDICYENKFHKIEIILCKTCKKKICYKCFIKYIKSYDNLLEYKCPYCRCNPNIIELSTMLNKLGKNIKLKTFMEIKINIINHFKAQPQEDENEFIILIPRRDTMYL